MNRERKILLIILFFSVLTSLSFINAFILSEKRTEVLNRINLLEQQYAKLGIVNHPYSHQVIEKAVDLLAEEKSMFFSRNNTDPYEFGLSLISMLEQKGLTIKSYKTLEEKDSFFLEFSVEGRAASFFAFLDTVYSSGKKYRFPYLSIQNREKGIHVDFRIGYAFYE